jgi:hypothetical protein
MSIQTIDVEPPTIETSRMGPTFPGCLPPQEGRAFTLIMDVSRYLVNGLARLQKFEHLGDAMALRREQPEKTNELTAKLWKYWHDAPCGIKREAADPRTGGLPPTVGQGFYFLMSDWVAQQLSLHGVSFEERITLAYTEGCTAPPESKAPQDVLEVTQALLDAGEISSWHRRRLTGTFYLVKETEDGAAVLVDELDPEKVYCAKAPIKSVGDVCRARSSKIRAAAPAAGELWPSPPLISLTLLPLSGIIIAEGICLLSMEDEEDEGGQADGAPSAAAAGHTAVDVSDVTAAVAGVRVSDPPPSPAAAAPTTTAPAAASSPSLTVAQLHEAAAKAEREGKLIEHLPSVADAPLEGKRVRLTGLKAKPELNDALGTVGTYDEETGRYAVRLEDNVRIALKKVCLRVVDEEAELAADLVLGSPLTPVMLRVQGELRTMQWAKDEVNRTWTIRRWAYSETANPHHKFIVIAGSIPVPKDHDPTAKAREEDYWHHSKRVDPTPDELLLALSDALNSLAWRERRGGGKPQTLQIDMGDDVIWRLAEVLEPVGMAVRLRFGGRPGDKALGDMHKMAALSWRP